MNLEKTQCSPQQAVRAMNNSDGEGPQETIHESPFKSREEQWILSLKLFLGFYREIFSRHSLVHILEISL